jgi:hypothetical protein
MGEIDIRRDRPSRTQRRTPTNSSERAHLQRRVLRAFRFAGLDPSENEQLSTRPYTEAAEGRLGGAWLRARSERSTIS